MENTIKIIFLIVLTIIIIYNLFHKKQINKKTKITRTTELTQGEFLKNIINHKHTLDKRLYLGNRPAILDFYANWCPPCKVLAPILEELAEEYQEELIIYKINTETEKELATLFQIRSIPTLVFIPMDKQPQVISGLLPKDQLKNLIDHFLLNKIQPK